MLQFCGKSETITASLVSLGSHELFISPVFVPVALLRALLLIDDGNRHQFACGGRRGLQITFRQQREKKEDEATITGEIIGSAGDQSPLKGGKQRGREAIHSSLKRRRGSGFSARINRKLVVSVRGAIFLQQGQQTGVLRTQKLITQMQKSN